MSDNALFGSDQEANQLIYTLDIVGLSQLPRCRPSTWSGAFQNELLDYGTAFPIVHPPSHPPALHVAAVMMAKDEQDIIGLNLRWLRRSGFRRFVIIENGSTDGTQELLREFRKSYPDCEVLIIDDPITRYMQSEKTTGAYELASCVWPDVTWVFPIDADELLIVQSDLAELDRIAPDVSCIVLPKVVHFRDASEHRFEAEESTPFWIGMPLRSQLFFVPPKVALRASAHNILSQGNHSAKGPGGIELECVGGLGQGLCYREFQTRSFSHFHRKAVNGAAALRAADAHTGQITTGRHWETWNAFRDSGSEEAFRNAYLQTCLRSKGPAIEHDPLPLDTMLKDF